MVRAAKNKRNTPKTNRTARSIGTLIISQIIAALICFAVVFGMHSSSNQAMKNCAAAFGNALRYNAGWTENAKTAAKWLSEKFGGDRGDVKIELPPENIPMPDDIGGDITFQ